MALFQTEVKMKNEKSKYRKLKNSKFQAAILIGEHIRDPLEFFDCIFAPLQEINNKIIGKN